jgi:hypothetical protein
MADIQDNYIRRKDGTYLTKFPLLKLCEWQKDAIEMTWDATQVVYYVPRRAGKTTLLAFSFFARIIFQKELFKFGKKYICCHPIAGSLYEKFVGEWFSTCFGGAENLQDTVNNLWIPVPKIFVTYFQNETLNKKEEEWFFGPEPIIKSIDGVQYVKFLKEEFNPNDTGIITGVLFNGAIISLVPANSSKAFDKYTSGSAIYGVWAEELSTWLDDFVSNIALPAVSEKGGFVMSSATPPKDLLEPKKHWSYREIIKPAITSKNYVKEVRHFVDYYISNKVTEIKVVENDEVVTLKNTNKSVVIIGDYVKMFPYTPAGISGFLRQTAELKVEVKITEERNAAGHYVRNQYGDLIYNITFGKPRPEGKMTLTTFDREFRMSFEGVEGKNVIDKFRPEINVVDVSSLDLDRFPTLTGFDKGLKDMEEGFTNNDSMATSGHDRSATFYVSLKYLGNGQWLVYEEGFMNFEYGEVGRFFYSKLRSGSPVVFDNAIDRRDSLTRTGRKDSSFSRVIDSYSPLANSDLQYGLIPCKKIGEAEKIKRYNNLFDTEDKELILKNAAIPELNRSNLYISSKCIYTIEFFTKWKTNVLKVKKMVRNDVWDTMTYPIDTFEFDEEKKQVIQDFWRENHGKKRSPQYTTVMGLRRNTQFIKMA